MFHTFLCARLTLCLLHSLLLYARDTFANPLPLRMPKHTIQEEKKIDEIQIINIELLLRILIVLFTLFNFFMLRVHYIISTLPWMSPVSKTEVLYQSIHWSKVGLITATLQSLFNKATQNPPISQFRSKQFRGTRSSLSDASQQIGSSLLTLCRFRNTQNLRHEGDADSAMPSDLSTRTTSADACVNSTTITSTSHSPVLSLSPSSGFYSLIEESLSTRSAKFQSSVEAQDSVSNEIVSEVDTKYFYSRNSPLETISEEFEELSSENQVQVETSKRSSALSSYFSDAYESQNPNLRFIFFQPQAELNLLVKHLQTTLTSPVPSSSKNRLSEVVSIANLPARQIARPIINIPVGSEQAVISTEHEHSKENSSASQGLLTAKSASTDSGETFHSTMSSLWFINNAQPTQILPTDMSIPPSISGDSQTQSAKTPQSNTHPYYGVDLSASSALTTVRERFTTSLNQISQLRQEFSTAEELDLISIPSENF